MNIPLQQRTLAKSVSCSGIGLHSGKNVNLTVKPAPPNHGIKFRRMDLPGKPTITAHFNMVVDTSLATVLGFNGFIVSTIEHLMSSLAGLAIDNALVEIDDYEVPIMDGSAAPFVDLLLSAGIEEQKAPRCFFVIKKPIRIDHNGKSVCIYPDPTYRITCTIDYSHPLIGNQTYTLEVCDKHYESEISPARTFGFLKELEYMQRYGLARGGSLDNAVVLGGDHIVNDGGLRFHDEFVRHKILDCIGDFSLIGIPMLGHVVASKSGHEFNHAFLKQFFAQKDSWETLMGYDIYECYEPKALAI